MPSSTGILTSRITRSGRSSRASSIARCPSPAWPTTSYPSSPSISARSMRMSASSSAITTRRTPSARVLLSTGWVTGARLVRIGFRRRFRPGSPTAEAMLSNSIQCEFESHPGHRCTVGACAHDRPWVRTRRAEARSGTGRGGRLAERSESANWHCAVDHQVADARDVSYGTRMCALLGHRSDAGPLVRCSPRLPSRRRNRPRAVADRGGDRVPRRVPARPLPLGRGTPTTGPPEWSKARSVATTTRVGSSPTAPRTSSASAAGPSISQASPGGGPGLDDVRLEEGSRRPTRHPHRAEVLNQRVRR